MREDGIITYVRFTVEIFQFNGLRVEQPHHAYVVAGLEGRAWWGLKKWEAAECISDSGREALRRKLGLDLIRLSLC